MGFEHRVKSAHRHARRVSAGLCILILAFLGTGVIAGGAGAKVKNSPRSKPSSSQPARLPAPEGAGRRTQALADYGKLPLAFEPNRGQTDPRVQFLSHGPGYTLFLTPDGAVLKLERNRESGVGSQGQSRQSSVISGQSRKTTDHGQRTTDDFELRLLGANTAAAFTGSNELPGKTNYFRGKDPAKWLHEIPNYARVEASEIYPGISLAYYGTPSKRGQLEYDFMVAPGGDPKAITLAVAPIYDRRNGGHRPPLQIDVHGDLVIQTASGQVRFLKPVVYQEQESGVRSQESGVGGRSQRTKDYGQRTTDTRHFLDAHYVLLARNRVGFKIPKYDKSRTLVIDPVLSYSTYVGGSGIDVANGIAVGIDGTAYVAGSTSSLDFPVAHALQPDDGGRLDFPQDAFVAKLSADGTTLLYSTYLGGKDTDEGNGIAVDTFGNAYVIGTTLSPDFPVTPGALNTLCGGDGKCGASLNPGGFIVSNAFVSKLNTEGSALIYSTFFGEYEIVHGQAITVDGNQVAYITGSTGPNITPTVTITPPNVPPPPFPIVNAFQPGYGGGATDAFVAKISSTGTNVEYSSYVGGSDEEVGNGIAVDSNLHALVTGLTFSNDFPTFNGLPLLVAVPSSAGKNGDSFLTAVNPAASGALSLLYSTLINGNQHDQGNAVAVDSTGKVYVAGTTASTNLPFSTAGFLQPTCALNPQLICDGDAFVAKFDPTLAGPASLLYFTFLGGSGADGATGIGVDTAFNAYLTGITNSTDFPTAGVPFQATYGGGNSDAFVAKLNSGATALLYSSFLGGSNADSGSGIAVDTFGNAYVTGQTCSTDFPIHLAEQTTPGGNCDAFVSKVLVGPDITISPTNLVFPAQGVGTVSAPQTVTITSNGDSPLILGAVTISGEFLQSNSCSGATLAPGLTCTITVNFSPTSPGPQSGTLTIPDNVPGSPQTISLSGLVTNVFAIPTTRDFGNQLVGTTSTPLTVTLTNASGSALTIFGIGTSGDFAQNNNCGNTLPAGMSCTISITFTPTGAGIRNGTLTVTDSDSSSPQTVALTGHGNAPVVSVAPSSLSFGTQGATGPAQTVTLTNNGDGPLNISNVAVTSPFAETPTCGTTLVAGASCTFSVTFVPTAPGTFNGQLTITDNNGGVNGSTQTVSLSGTAVVPVALITPVSLNFGSVIIGTVSAPQTVTITNIGNASLTVASALVSADYTALNNCVVPLPANTSCTIDVTFAPASAGSLAGALIISDNAPGSPQSVGLSGLGITKFVTVAPGSLTFPNQLINTSSSTIAVTFSNTGATAVSITGINISGTNATDFAETNTCGASVAGGNSCTVNVTFTPTGSGIRTGALTFTDSDPSSPQTVSLTGNGTAPVVSLSPTSLNFGNQGATGPSQAITLTNTGNGLMNIVSITVSAQFSESDNCPASLAPAGICTITVSFLPTGAGAVTGTLTITDNAANSPQTATLSGNGTLPVATLSPLSLTFPSEPEGVASSGQAVTLTNTGSATLNITSISISGDFAETNTCSSSISPNGACSINVTFTPTGLGARTGTLSITDNAAGSPQTVALSGSGGDFAMAISPPSATFFAGQSSSFTVTVTPSFGFDGKVSFACANLPSDSSCAFSSGSVTLNGTSSTNVTATVNTTARVTAPPRGAPGPAPPNLPWGALPLGFVALAMLAAGAVWSRRSRRAGLVLAMALLIALSWFACAGGNPVNAPTGTPAGTYTITISGVSGSVSHNVTATLTVK